jgi:phosphopantetheine adenylyltransferase
MHFSDFLAEANKNKTIVFAFGRFNPPTIGHGLLVKKVVDTAKKLGADHVIYASRSQDSKKNPLSVQQKIKYLRKMFSYANFEQANEDVRTFIEVAKHLSKQKYSKIIMVAGSDRIAEYQKLFDKYNGKEFNFESAEVISAGERDPDADGAAGMSGTKMREAAVKNDFKTFRKGIPETLSDNEAKSLMRTIRLSMNIHEFVQPDMDTVFEKLIIEGVHDKAIFKAVFLAGGPGSGKDYVLSNTLDGHGLVEINSDKAFEFLMDKEGLNMTMPESEREQRDFVRGRAKSVTELRQRLALLGRNGLIINGTGDDYEKVSTIKKKLEELGYDTSMVLVNTRDEVSQQRNIERGQRGGRTVPENIRKEKWDGVQKSRTEYAKLFGDKYVEFDNSEDLRSSDPEIVKQKKQELQDIFKRVKEFTSKAPGNDVSKFWIANELNKKDTLPIDKKGTQRVPSSTESGAYQEAMKLGLSYLGFGRYGKNGKVTHHSVHDKLVEVGKYKTPKVEIAISGSGSGLPRKKKPVKVKEQVNTDFDNFINEAVSITVTGDSAEEVTKTLKLLKSDVKEQTGTTLSDNGALNVLTLGKPMVRESTDYVCDKDGNKRKFAIRDNAAKEAHRKNGQVEKKGKLYFVKLKTKKTISEIDYGTEVGIPMSGYNKEKIDRNTGKAVSELTGDETGASIGDQKDDELKKQGISLTSFRTKKGNIS